MVPPSPSHIVLEQAEQDRLIAVRLPAWVRSLSHTCMAAFSQAVQDSLDYRHQLARLWLAVEGLDTFAEPLLQQALETQFGVRQQVSELWFRDAYNVPLKTYAPIRVPLTERVYYQVPLLEAALRNFTTDETLAGGLAPDAGLYDGTGTRLAAPSARQFASLVRELDVGQRYQQHLQSRLNTPWMKTLLGSSVRHEMLLDAFQAHHQGVLDPAELQWVIWLWREGLGGRLNDAPVVAKRLELLGCPLQQIVVFDVRDETFAPLYTSSRRVLVYIPGDPEGAWSAFEDLQRFARKILGQRLRRPAYQQFFSRFVRRRDSQVFFAQVIEGYHDLAIWANIDLGEKMHPLSQPLFDTLASARIAQIQDDAATLAMPVAQLDRELQQAHERRLAMEGWTLFSLAGLFVPVIGALMLAVTAWQLLEEVFWAVQAWHEGETREALEHVTHVATDVAVIAAMAAGVTVARQVWQRSVRVDSLVQARLEDGSERLWKGDLVPFRSDPPPAQAVTDEQGISRHDEQAWISMLGQHYRVSQRQLDDQWQLLPREGHGPLLQHNSAGAWRLWSEQPAQWQGRAYLFRRLGGAFSALDDQHIDQVLAIHDINADQLRALHVYGRAPDAGLADSAVRAGIEQRIGDTIAQLRAGQRVSDSSVLTLAQGLDGATGVHGEALAALTWQQRRLLLQKLYDRLPQPEVAGSEALARVFPGLHRRMVQSLMASANVEDHERLLQTGRVPLHLDEAARAALLEVRVARAFEGLYLAVPQSLDFARLTLGMLKYVGEGDVATRWRLFANAASDTPLIESGEGSRAFDLVHEGGQFQLHDATGSMLGEPGELFEVLAHAYDARQRAALYLVEPFAGNLQVLVAQIAQARRKEVYSLLGGAPGSWFRMPSRLADGRLGYPLSGRGAAQPQPGPYLRRIRYLYPTFTSAQVFAWIEDARQSSLGLERLLRSREHEFEVLNAQLRSWVRAGRSHEERSNRRRLKRALRACWQHVLDEGEHGDDLLAVYRWDMVGTRTDSFPELPEQIVFSHVNALTLRGMQLASLPESFLRAFPNVRILELPGNQLTRIPQALLQMPQLQCLDLYNNQIVLDSTQATILANCRNLVFLNLARNPLGRPFSVNGLTRLNELRLNGTGISEVPYLLMDNVSLRALDLSDNLLASMPDGFYESRLWVEGNVQLRGNPFTAPERQRLHEALLAAAPADNVQVVAPARLRWMDAIGLDLRTELGSCWNTLAAAPRAGDFFHLLERLLETADFRHLTGGRYLATRVLTLLRAMRDMPELCEQMFSNAEQLTCQDSVALRFSDLELRLLVWQAQAEAAGGHQERLLLRLGRQLWRLDQLDQIALQDIQQRQLDGGNPDQVEVALAYRLALRVDLDLPIQTNGMSFREVAGVDARRIRRARDRVLAAESGERLAASLLDREFWRTHLRAAHRDQFEHLDAPYHERLEQLQEDQALAEATRLARMNQLLHERQAAERELMLQLSLSALDAYTELEVIQLR